MKITLSDPPTPFRDAVYVGISVLMCFVASAYFIYNQASARNNFHNRQRLESIAWRTANALDLQEHETLAHTALRDQKPATYARVQRPAREAQSNNPVISRIFTVSFDGTQPHMVVDSEGFPARSWERLPSKVGTGGDFSKETMYFCTLSVQKTAKSWVGEIAFPGSIDSLVVAMVPIGTSQGHPQGVLVVESTSERLHPTLASLRTAALYSVLIGSIVSLVMGLAVYTFRKKHHSDANLLTVAERAERALVEAIGEAIYRVETSSGKISWEGNLTGMGWAADRSIPKTRSEWDACIHPDDLARSQAAWSREAGNKWNMEYRIIGGDGRVYWLLDRGQHLESDANRTISVGTLLNLSPLRDTEQRLRDVVDAAGEYIWEVDSEGHYTFLSERVVDVLGYPLEKLIGRHPLSFVPPEDVDEVRSKSEELSRTQKTFRDFQHRMVRADGQIIWLNINGVPVSNMNGQVSGYRGAGLDITARKRAEEALIQEKESALAADRAKSEFLAVMSHEIRTPLNSVLGFADLLAESTLEQPQREQLEMIRRSGDALLVLLNDILDFSRIESGKMPIQTSSVDIRACLNDVVNLYGATSQAKGIALRVDVAPDIPHYLCTDPGRLRQILLNLVGNAVKFTPEGEVVVSATLNSTDPNNDRPSLLIAVSDSGIGIPPDRVTRLFKPFSQADSSTTRRFGGTGLGLAICKRLAELLGGDVRLERSSSSGSVFALELPMVAVPEGQEQTSTRATDIASGPTGNRAWRILVVEDNKVNRVLTQRMLLSLGFQSDAAENGLKGIQAHAAQPYDIIFMDIQMPVMDGVEASGYLRKRENESPELPHVHIIALTADAMVGDRQRCLEVGMNDYLSKPIRRADLSAALDRASQAILAPSPEERI